MKRYSFGNNNQHLVSLSYTNRSQVSQYEINFVTPFSNYTIGGHYQYGADGRLSSSTETTDNRHDRAYTYDHVARLTQALTGAEARGETPTPGWDPFKQNYGYNAWGNLASRTGHHWGTNQPAFTATFVNGRNTNPQWQYDADGQVLLQVNQQITRQYVYDAAGRQISMTEPPRRPNRPAVTVTQGYDGDGGRVKYVTNSTVGYELRSTVLGGRVITELNAQGVKTKGHVYANGGKLARQSLNEVTWVHDAPDGTGEWESIGSALRSLELDPLGDDVGVDDPYASGDGLGDYPAHGDPADFDTGCTLDGGPIVCEVIGRWFSRNRTNILHKLYNGDLRTPPTFPGDQITFGNILQATLEDLPFGDFLYPKPEKLWRTINPFIPRGSLFAKPPCPPVPTAPANANVDDNIRAAAGSFKDALEPKWYAGPDSGEDPMGKLAGHAMWFFKQVKDKGPWDYKYRDPAVNEGKRSKYEPFGNFNYGAAGAAAGFSEGQLLRLAGHYQTDKTYAKGEDPGLLRAILGVGGRAPYGDEPEDQDLIRRGVDYYRRKFVLKDCQ